jgi:Uma2 family endonuclease
MVYPVQKQNKKYNYGDYLKWPESTRCELINGAVYNMVPAPSVKHQRIVGELFRQISNYLLDKECEIFVAPFDVRLPKGVEKDDEINTVVQPDLTVICDKDKLDDKGYKGSPDLIIEVVSQNTLKKDISVKFSLYEQVGVKEYWIVYPKDKTVMVFKLGEDSMYGEPDLYRDNDSMKPGIFVDLQIDLVRVFNK